MKKACGSRSWQLLVIIMLLTGSLFAASSAAILYSGQNTTVNCKPVYVSALFAVDDQVRTVAARGKMRATGMELDLAPGTSVVVGEPLFPNSGSVVDRPATVAIRDGKSTASLGAGQSLDAPFTSRGDALPDAPSAVRSEREKRSPNWSYWTVNGLMLGSSVVSAELTQRCLYSGACDWVPDALHSRGAMYGAGLPAASGVSYLSYYLKKKGYRWWFVPAALVTAGNIVASTHAAHYSH
jgi:hypothetical protein